LGVLSEELTENLSVEKTSEHQLLDEKRFLLG
jgi:hypothetical protein